MKLLSKPMPNGSGPQGFAKCAEPKSQTATSRWIDMFMKEPQRGVLQDITLRYKDGSQTVIPRFHRMRKRNFENEMKPEVVRAVESGKNIEITMHVETSEGRPYESVFVAKFSQGFPIKVKPSKAQDNHEIPDQSQQELPGSDLS